MSEKHIRIFIAAMLLLVFLAPACKRGGHPVTEKFKIISEVKTDKDSPFFIDTKKYPSKRNSLPIGIFDSGTGGLTVLNSILELDKFNNKTHEQGPDSLPDFEAERFIYLADEANMPYGKYNAEGKADFLRELVIKDVRFLLGNDYYEAPADSMPKSDKAPVKAIVIACNTATAYGLETVRGAVDSWGLNIPILGIIDAGAKSALLKLKPGEENNAVIGVLATEGTCASGGYPASIKNYAKQNFPGNHIHIAQQAGIGLAGAIDGDLNYIDPAANTARSDEDYKGPGLNHPQFPIDTSLWAEYNFEGGNGLLIEKNDKGGLVKVQLNSVGNYIKYCTTHLVVKIVEESPGRVLNSIILGCTHYPFFEDEIRSHLMFLKQLDEKYDKIIPGGISFIDPAQSLAYSLYNCLAKDSLWGADDNVNSEFFISVPNPRLASNEIDANGEFPYEYKYGRAINSSNQFVRIVPFSDKWVSKSIKARIKQDIPTAYQVIYKN
ncbi:Glutamate racemase [hydrothermal vent metagenome]|uniref:Glutamate racemase n=1 Tax=hydrothermal vent metagenome TaxID=652676 RepID=A0A3B0U3S2_9ZZZZ